MRPFFNLRSQWSISKGFATSLQKTWPKLVIPKRIERSPTDILKVLSNTIDHHQNIPSFKFYDDPYLYAISNIEKRNYTLSRESGKKAARWIRDNHADLFNHQPDNPVIKKFLPRSGISENENATEDDLISSIENFQVSEAVSIFQDLKSKSQDIKDSVRQSLLELVSFFNCEDSIDPEWVNELSYKLPNKANRPIKSWRDNGLAEELFAGLKDNGAKPYCALIRGMCAYNQVDRAYSMYQECLSKGFIPDTDTFNALIRIAPFLKDENDLRWSEVREFLEKMVELKVVPNLGTMNSVLRSFTYMRNWSRVKTLALQTLSEFRALGIEPSLASYYHLLRIFYTHKNTSSPLLINIMDEIEEKEFIFEDVDDKLFFHTAMEICRKDLQSMETARRLHNMLRRGENHKFLNHSIYEAVYYRNYLCLAVNSMPFDNFIEMYDCVVPHIFSPDREVMEEIVKCIGVSGDLSFLPRIWSDCILMEVARNEKLMEMALMVIKNSSLEDESSELRSQLTTIAWDIWTRIQNQDERFREKVEWTGHMLGDCLSSLSRYNELEKVSEILVQILETPGMVLGVIPLESLQIVFNACIEAQLFTDSLNVVKLVKDSDYIEYQEMAKQLKETAPTEFQNKIVSAFGAVVL